MRRIFVPFRKTWLFSMLLAAVLLVGVATTVYAQTTPTWQLMNYHQSSCFDTNVHDTYYGIWIKGTWSHQINVGITTCQRVALTRLTMHPLHLVQVMV